MSNIIFINSLIQKLDSKMYIIINLNDIYGDLSNIQNSWLRVYTLFEGWASTRRSNQIEEEKVIPDKVSSRH